MIQLRLATEDIGGGALRRGAKLGHRFYPANTRFTGDELRAMVRPLNMRSMIDAGVLTVWPKPQAEPGNRNAVEEPGISRIAVHRGFGAFDVVEGRILNDQPLTKEQAKALVSQKPSPPH